MKRLRTLPVVLVPAFLAGCATHRDGPASGTLAELRDARPDVEEVTIEQGLEQAMEGYRRFLEETPETAMTPEAMRRLADLQIEKEFGIRGGDGAPRELAAPESGSVAQTPLAGSAGPVAAAGNEDQRESDQDFEQRTTAASGILWGGKVITSPPGAAEAGVDPSGPLEAIALYDRLLSEYPNYEHKDKVLYQKARAYDELGRTEEAIATMERLIGANPHSEHLDEVQFRRGEYFFTRRRYLDAEEAYGAILTLGTASSYHELALYKLGWTLYKQELYEEALHRYIAVLDYRVSIGHDFDATHAEEDERRVADTFRVISFSFNNLGGPEAVREYFTRFGNRAYEDRVYSHLGEHYLAKLRYDDAAKSYNTFVSLYPYDRAAPHFSMRVVETFTKGGFPKLVLEAKRDFASRYGLQADYWQHFTPEDSPEVLAYLKTNLKDLATHYHAEYQALENGDDKLASYGEAARWYGDYLASFPTDADAPPINYQFADLLLEHESFGEAARQYERTAYDYPPHDQSAGAGYAAVFAHREHLKTADTGLLPVVRQATVASSLKFADTFPEHEHAATILGAAADDLYEMKNYPAAVAAAQRVLETYPDVETPIRRSAWVVVAHGSFDLADYPQAEQAYAEVLTLTPKEDDARVALVDNLAASIYKQGEAARDAEDHRTAADHFLRIRTAAPTSTIRPAAEFDAGAALLALEDWTAAADVLETFRSTYPEHELHLEATRLIANAYQKSDQLARAAGEYDRIASMAADPAMQSEALLVAGDLYEQSGDPERALDVYRRFVNAFPRPVEPNIETRFKIAELHKAAREEWLYHEELAEIIRLDREAGRERTARTRTLAGRSALVLAEKLYHEFTAVRLRQPFETSLLEKQQRMDVVIDAMGRLVEYEIADVTAAATYYMAETYFDFSRALTESERPGDLQPAELQEYEMVLEEEAFPFEEKSIDLHEENLELLQAGVFNDWTEKSLGKLVALMPGRYARHEMSVGLLAAIDSYEYRAPVSQVAGPEISADGTAEPDPVPTSRLMPIDPDDETVEHARPN